MRGRGGEISWFWKNVLRGVDKIKGKFRFCRIFFSEEKCKMALNVLNIFGCLGELLSALSQ